MSASAAASLPPTLRDATERQEGARAALAAALAEPSHAYLFAGPAGSGKRAAARAFAAELLAASAPNPDDTRRRALADPSPHPDLAWLRPRGSQHLVAEVRERVIAAAAYRPFEAERRVFVIEDAEAMADESQNALLKTLEEPAPFVHLILVSSEPTGLLETVRSRCQPIRFLALSPEQVEAELAERGTGADELERRAAARLAAGSGVRAEFLASEAGRELRGAAEALVRAALDGELAGSPWSALLDIAEAEGGRAAARARAQAEEEAAEAGDPKAARRSREVEEDARRVGRRARTQVLDLGLALVGYWLRDLAATAEGAEELALNADRAEELRREAEGVDARRARVAAELVMDTRRRLQVNVSEELALQALLYRFEGALAAG